MATSVVEASTDNLRQKVMEVARSHKASWIRLGQYLYSVHKDKLFKGWGFLTFEAYCTKDLGIKQATASKLLKSYAFLEKEEPSLASEEAQQHTDKTPSSIPDYEAVNLLRLAKENESITPREFSVLREAVLEKAKEPKQIRAQVKQILDDKKPEGTPEEVEIKRHSKIRRFVSLLKTASREFEEEDLLPDHLAKQIQALIGKLEDQVRE